MDNLQLCTGQVCKFILISKSLCAFISCRICIVRGFFCLLSTKKTEYVYQVCIELLYMNIKALSFIIHGLEIDAD